MIIQLKDIGIRKWVGNFNGLMPPLHKNSYDPTCPFPDQGAHEGDIAIDTSQNPRYIWQCIIDDPSNYKWVRIDQLGSSGSNIDYVFNRDIDDGQTEMIDQFRTSEGKAATWEYVIQQNNNMRTGTFKACWNSNNQVEYYEESTPDIGDTSYVVLNVRIENDFIIFEATVQSGGGDNWCIDAARIKIM